MAGAVTRSKRRVSGCSRTLRRIAPVHPRGHSFSHQRKRHIDTLHKLHVVDQELLPADSELLDCASQDKPSLTVTKINDCDMNSAYRESVNVSKLIEVPGISVDLDIEIAAVLAEEQRKTIVRGIKAKVQVDVVGIHIVA